MTLYERIKSKRLGDVLVDEDLATEEAVIAALHEHQRTGALLSDILMEARAITEWDLARIVVDQYQMPYIDLSSYTLHKDLIAKFPPQLLSRARVVPLERFGQLVAFACQEVPEADAVKELSKNAPGGVYLYAASARDIREVLHQHAPVTPDELDVESVASEGAPIPLNMNEDQSWQNLFDAADEAIQSGDE